MTQSSGRPKKGDESTLSERLLFAVWLSGKILGTENSKQFAAQIQKGASQLSKWVNESPRPSWENIKLIADAVRISAVWLDDPSRSGAQEPDEFPEWLASRRRRQQPKRSRSA